MTESTHTAGSDKRRLVLIHGRDFKPVAEDYLDLSVAALEAGIARDQPEIMDRFRDLPKHLAYYGDITHGFLTGAGMHYDEQLDIGDRRNALLEMKLIDKRKNFGVNRYDRLPGKTATTEFAADIAAPLLGSIGLSKALISTVGKDLGEYWNKKSDFGAMIRDRVRAEICAALDSGDTLLLMSHGTGCIVVYDVLWQLSNDPRFKGEYGDKKIDTWLTLGAPLGDSMTKRRLLGAREKGREKYPSNVVTWHNVSAEDDFLCHDNTLADDYKPMLKQRMVSSVRDYRIYNMAVRYGKSNPHSSIGYLIHPRIAKIICDWLQQTRLQPAPKYTL